MWTGSEGAATFKGDSLEYGEKDTRIMERGKRKVSSVDYSLWVVPSIAVLVVASLWIVNWIAAPGKDSAEAGQFGDKFGAVNALFSGLAFAGIIYTLLLQRKDLKMQREEMQMQREEFEKQNFQNVFFGLMKHQSDLLQRFDARFFRMELSLVRDTEFKEEPRRGASVFVSLRKEHARITAALESKVWEEWDSTKTERWQTRFALRRKEDAYYDGDSEEFDAQNSYTCFVYKIKKETWEFGSSSAPIERARLAYAILYQKYGFALGPYFRHFYHILKFIKEAKTRSLASVALDDFQKIQLIDREFASFTQFVQASLSPTELYLALFNALNFPKALDLVREFHILDNLEEEELNGIESGNIQGITFKRRANLIEKALRP